MTKRIIKTRKLPLAINETIPEEERRAAATKKVAHSYSQKTDKTVYSRLYSYKKNNDIKGE